MRIRPRSGAGDEAMNGRENGYGVIDLGIRLRLCRGLGLGPGVSLVTGMRMRLKKV